MAALSRSRRSSAGIALIIAGVLFLAVALSPYIGMTVFWVVLLADVAIAVALVILGLGAVNNTVAKVAFFAGAVGWAILALAGLGVVALPGGLTTIAAVVAAAGGVVGAIVLYTGKEITNRPAAIFIAAMVLAAIYLLVGIGVFPIGSLGTVLLVLFGAALVVAGVLFRRTERTRR